MIQLRLLAAALACAGVLGLCAWARSHYIGVGAARVQARWDAQMQADARHAAEQAREAERIERDKEQRRQTEAERIAHEHAQLHARLADGQRAAAAAERRLHTTITILRQQLHTAARAPGIDADAAAHIERASTAAGLLGTCAGRYGAVAADADRLAAQVSGLHDWIRSVCQPGPKEATP